MSKERLLRRIERVEEQHRKAVDQTRRQIDRFEAKLMKDPIEALQLTYSREEGIISHPIEIDSKLIKGSISLGASSRLEGVSPGTFNPLIMISEEVVVKPLEYLFTRYATILAFEIRNDDTANPAIINWVRRSTPSTSLVCLIDPVNQEYYYPVSTDLSGQVVAGVPKRGFIAFQPLRHAVSRLVLNFSPKCLPGRESTLQIELDWSHLFQHTEAVLNDATLSEHAERELRRSIENVAEEAQKARRKVQGSGCTTLAIVVIVLAVVVMVIVMANKP